MTPFEHKLISSIKPKIIYNKNNQLKTQKHIRTFFVSKKFLHTATSYKIKTRPKQRNIILKTKMAFLIKFQKIKQKQVSIKQRSPGRVSSRAKITILRG
jgi:hypothetical protein